MNCDRCGEDTRMMCEPMTRKGIILCLACTRDVDDEVRLLKVEIAKQEKLVIERCLTAYKINDGMLPEYLFELITPLARFKEQLDA